MFDCHWLPAAVQVYERMRKQAEQAYAKRVKSKKTKSTKAEGLFKQVRKTLELLRINPRHPGLKTHAYDSIENPFDKTAKVFEAYVQNHTSAAYRIFWCYGPEKQFITILAIVAHP